MARKCSNCGNNGHNSRTCKGLLGTENGGGLRLFGVQLQVGNSSSPDLKKCFSMESLVTHAPSICASSCSPSVSSSSSLVSIDKAPEQFPNDYFSDGLMARTQERRKGIPWSEEEHRRFLAGLEKLGKGDWRGISKHFVSTRSPTQVASHAQKHFLRQTIIRQKKRRSSVFDLVEAPYISQSPRIPDQPSLSNFKFPSVSLNVVSSQEINMPNYLNFMSYPVSVNVVPSVMLQPSPLTSNGQIHTETPNLKLSIAPLK